MSLGLPPRAGSPVDPEIRGFWQRPQQREDLHSFRTPTRLSSIHPVHVHATSRDGSPLNLISPDQRGRAVSRNRQVGAGTPS
jgi:hypothetical protein